MKKQLAFLCLVLFGLGLNAQKASVKTSALTATFEQPEALKNIKTFSYELQDDSLYWNYTPTKEFPTLTSITPKLNISGLEQVSEDADLKIIVGFLGNQLKKGEGGALNLNGTYNILLLNKENQVLSRILKSVDKQVINTGNYAINTRDARNLTKAKIVTEQVERILKTQEHLFSGSADLEVPFGLFKKTKGGNAEAFNNQAQPLIDAIIADPSNTDKIDEAITFWKSQLEVDFGKKVKDKTKNKVIYSSLTTAYLLKGDLENAKTSHDILNENTGFFDLWTPTLKAFMARYEMLDGFKLEDPITLAITPNSMYITTIEGGTYQYKQKDPIEFSKIEIEAFVPELKSGIASLDSDVKPKIFIYEKGIKTLRHFSDGNNVITTNDGTVIEFKVLDGVYRPFVKQESGSYKLFNGSVEL